MLLYQLSFSQQLNRDNPCRTCSSLHSDETCVWVGACLYKHVQSSGREIWRHRRYSMKLIWRGRRDPYVRHCWASRSPNFKYTNSFTLNKTSYLVLSLRSTVLLSTILCVLVWLLSPLKPRQCALRPYDAALLSSTKQPMRSERGFS